MKKNIFILISLISLLFSSCQKLFVDENPDNTPVNNFEMLWEQLDQRYCYFNEKHVDWQAVHDKYRPMVYNGMNDQELFEVMKQMANELKDGHVNVITPFDLSAYRDFYLPYEPNFNANIINYRYLGNDFSRTGDFSYKIIDNIGYIYYSQFGAYSEETFDHVFEVMQNCKGIVLDIRNNGGGYVNTMYKLAGRFTTSSLTMGYSKYKSGPAHDEFSKLFEEKITPSGKFQWTKPAVVLTNRKSYSAANIFPGLVKMLDHVTLMGDTTGGGSASPQTIRLLNGWDVRISSLCFLDINQHTLEFGVAPEIISYMKKTDEIQGIDSMIEDAFAYIKSFYE